MKRDYSFFFKHPFFESCKSLLQKLYYYLLETRDKGQGTRDKTTWFSFSLYSCFLFSGKKFFCKKMCNEKTKKETFF